ncbi:MAG: TonB-dependent receptor [Pseudomonadota bacterium]
MHYEASWYLQFAPRTALDMVNQTPGFAPDWRAGGNRRGLSGAAGNVLIDGERPSAKSQTLADILQRIPAKQVVRVELLRGAEVAGDPSGAAVLANVVRASSAGAGTWSAGFEYAPRQDLAPNGYLSWSGRAGPTDYAIGASSNSFQRDLPGRRHVLDALGNVTAVRIDASPREYVEHAVNAELVRAALGGRLALTGEVSYSRYDEDSTLLTTTPSGDRLEDEANPYAGVTHTYEGGLNFGRSAGSWDLTLAALLTRRRSESDVSSTHRNSSVVIDSVSVQALARNSGESVARLTASRNFAAHRIEAGIESTVNTLDAGTIQSQDLGGGWTEVYVPNANVRVEEGRQEAFAGYIWRPGSPWSMEARLTADMSRLHFAGDVNRSVDLVYWKPLLQIGRLFGERNQLQFRMFRDIGQLDFNDFVSAPSLADDVVNGGNPALRPETSWRAEFVADVRIGADSAFGIKGFHYRLADAIDLVPIGAPGMQIDAPANIGDGKVTGIDLTGSLPLRTIFPGGVIDVVATLQESEIADPITGAQRTISDFQTAQLRAEFRQDLAAQRFAWGINYSKNAQTQRFRFAEIDTHRGSPSLNLFVETTAIEALKVRLSALSVLDTELRERTFFAPDRTGAVSSIESGERRPGKWWMLTLSGNL